MTKPRRNAAFPDGHFYSPVVDTDDIGRRVDTLWPVDPEILGIDFNDPSHEGVLDDWFPRFMPAWDYPEVLKETAGLDAFYTRNSQFSWLDCRALFVILQAIRPRRMIEVGSGFSSLLTADVNRRFLGGELDFTCIEPYPREFLRKGIHGISRLLEARVEQVARSEFDALQAGDILFIDSSHVAKTGSDVVHLFFEVLPRRAPGVVVHVHDIFLPHDYPREWAITENRSWNEQYLLRALLMYSTAFEVLFGACHALHRHPERLARALGRADGRVFGGGSFWMVRR
jgi:hypothetical protein